MVPEQIVAKSNFLLQLPSDSFSLSLIPPPPPPSSFNGIKVSIRSRLSCPSQILLRAVSLCLPKSWIHNSVYCHHFNTSIWACWFCFHYFFLCLYQSQKLGGNKCCMKSSITVAKTGRFAAPALHSRRLLIWSSCWNIDANFALVSSKDWNLILEHVERASRREINRENPNSWIFFSWSAKAANVMWVSALTDKRLWRRDKSNLFRCCISPAQKGLGVFHHARDNIYISPEEDFLVLACVIIYLP